MASQWDAKDASEMCQLNWFKCEFEHCVFGPWYFIRCCCCCYLLWKINFCTLLSPLYMYSIMLYCWDITVLPFHYFSFVFANLLDSWAHKLYAFTQAEESNNSNKWTSVDASAASAVAKNDINLKDLLAKKKSLMITKMVTNWRPLFIEA